MSMGNSKNARANLQRAQQLFMVQGNSEGAKQAAELLKQLSLNKNLLW